MLNLIDYFLIPNYDSVKLKILFLLWKADYSRYYCEVSSSIEAKKEKFEAVKFYKLCLELTKKSLKFTDPLRI